MGIVAGIMGLASAIVGAAAGVMKFINYLEDAKRETKMWAENSRTQAAFQGEPEEVKQCGTAQEG